MQRVIAELQAADIGEVRLNEQMALHTTWKIGGCADLFVVPETKEQLITVIQILNRHQAPWFVLGRGSNLLVSDKGIRGVVVKLGEALSFVRFEGNVVYAGASLSFIKLSVMAGKQGLTGLEFAGGIPGSVGGAVYMNAGAHGSDISRILRYADVMMENGEVVRMQNEDFQYAYRHSILQSRPGIVLEAVFQLKEGVREDIVAAMAEHKARRLRTQPLHLAVAGSVFRNPPNDFSARLIEAAGLKGTRIGGAEVSTQHANFIVNTGEATSADVEALIRHIQSVIEEKFAVQLIPEVLVVGER